MMKRPLFAALLVCCLTSSAMAMDKSTYYVHDGVGDAAKVVYEYKPDSLFQVKAQMGCISDIELRPERKSIISEPATRNDGSSTGQRLAARNIYTSSRWHRGSRRT